MSSAVAPHSSLCSQSAPGRRMVQTLATSHQLETPQQGSRMASLPSDQVVTIHHSHQEAGQGAGPGAVFSVINYDEAASSSSLASESYSGAGAGAGAGAGSGPVSGSYVTSVTVSSMCLCCTGQQARRCSVNIGNYLS